MSTLALYFVLSSLTCFLLDRMKHMHPVFGSVNLLTLSCGLPPSAGTLVRVRRRRFFWKDPAVRLFQLTSEQQCREMNG